MDAETWFSFPADIAFLRRARYANEQENAFSRLKKIQEVTYYGMV